MGARERLGIDGPGALDLWWARPGVIHNPDLLDAYRALLNDDERHRHGRFLFARHRHLFLVARALVRSTLSLYAAVEPSAWRFAFNEHGRPDIHADHGLGDLRFNLSHTDGMAILAVGRGTLGVDVENITRRMSGINIAEHFFAPSEVAQLHGCHASVTRSRFFDYWTLKEAYIKARGMGLAIPLKDFAFDLERGARISVSFCGSLAAEEPGAWRFGLLRPTAEHRVAVAQRDAPELRLRCFETVPLTADTRVIAPDAIVSEPTPRAGAER